ncbi:DUF2232 domain-containing protein [Antrihabitans sp. YC2-6]|uniref:ABC transporter ATP-binding protein n=1 Tax=Antrihabitans sp. YC2-6 TaxID=2799498 RepID=UPI0018F3F67F|nr:ATP-binding cassette domain-containing protein [Antrihabitans sp. YC2-6]MBJ8344159.1 DUF2232 domain-containing protein [Antrihabitans sp. YC2-6]
MTTTPPETAPSGPLRPIELATGAVLGGVAISLSVLANLIPFLGALQLLAAIPMGIIAQRHRARAFLTATVCAGLVGFVAGGVPAVLSVASCAILGGIVGTVKRRGGGLASVLVYSTIAGLGSGAFAVGTLLVFSTTRNLLFDTLRDTARGIGEFAAKQSFLAPIGDAFADFVETALHYWWIWIGASVTIGTILSAIFAWFLLGAVIDRLAWVPAEDHLDAPNDDRTVAPLPVQLHAVSYRYPGGKTYALQGVELIVNVGEFVAVVGHNGSGKSTLSRILAGRPPTSGTVTRPGSAGLGKFGGTAVVMQRPESQILGVLVADDVVWGLPTDTEVDVEGLLAEVGLAGLGARETSSLSGGQQQRLAVAAALARQPSLLIADEATAMVDPAGRRELVALLSALPQRHSMAVVLITHQEIEAAAADRVIHLSGGRAVEHLPTWHRTESQAPQISEHAGEPLLRLSGVRHTYLSGTPWATEALHGIDLTVGRGEGVLLVGGNGSGKSTIAWIMAGLIDPTEGTCELAGRPMTTQVGRVGLAFQHSRLQLLRRTVGGEIASWGGPDVGSARVGQALDDVALDRILAGRGIDELSGGQARRVALAGILASKPRLVVLDEPLAGLDPEGRRGIIDLLGSLRRNGLTLVVISHDIEGMSTVCNRIVRLDGGRVATDEPSHAGQTS